MKRNRRVMTIFNLIVVMMLFSCMLTGCKKDAEVVSDIVEEESSTYETMAESSADRFTYDDLVVDNVKMGMIFYY